jgi:hypothetical protein
MVLNINSQVAEMGLDLSVLSELDTTSPNVAHTRTLLISTVVEHESENTNDGDQPHNAKIHTHSPEKVVHKRSSLVTNLGNRMESMKKGVKNRVFKLSNLTMKRLSPNSALIRLPSSPSEVLDGSVSLIIHATASTRVDPPGSPAFPEDDHTYRESKRLSQEWESKNEDYITPRSQQLVTEPNSQPSLEIRNNVT